MGIVLTVALLAGCGSGSSSDGEVGKAADPTAKTDTQATQAKGQAKMQGNNVKNAMTDIKP